MIANLESVIVRIFSRDIPDLIVDGDQCWYQNGKLHRDNGPAIVRPDGREEWYQNNKLA